MKLYLTDVQLAIEWHCARTVHESEGLKGLERLAQMMQGLATSSIEDNLLVGCARELWLEWYASTADTPCIAICSTSQGDDLCKGCGRTFEEVIHWLSYTPFEKRGVWSRITREAVAWRFNHYKERAR